MTRFRATILACALAVLTATAARADDRGAAFDKLFAQLDSEGLAPATPEEAKADIARLRALVPPGDRRRELLYQSTECFQPPDDADEALAYARRGLAASRLLADSEAQARFQMCEAAIFAMKGDPQSALQRYGQAVELARKAERPALVADGLVLRGDIYSYLGRLADALKDFTTAQRLYDNSRQKTRSEGNLQNIAVVYRRMGETAKAREYLDRSLEIARRHEDWSSIVGVTLQRGYMLEEANQPARALAEFEKALAVSKQRLGPFETGSTLMAMAAPQVALGRHVQALGTLDAARKEMARAADTSNEGMLSLIEGSARLGVGDTTRALALFDTAERVLIADGNERYLEMLYPQRATLYERKGDAAAALADYKRYLALREKLTADRNAQRSLMLHQEFDTSRREIENEQLRQGRTLREQEVQALRQARRWQRIAMGLGVALILVLGAIVGRQILRTRRLRVLALTDELTGVANRRRIDVMGHEAVAQARADERPLSVIAFDIDGFKDINDRHGHPVGDRVIARVAEACQQALRQFDEIGRTGGEEFVVLLPDSSIDAAQQVAERLRAGVEGLEFGDAAPGLRVTISLGVTSLAARDAGLPAVLARADQALYKAKSAGRNCIRTM